MGTPPLPRYTGRDHNQFKPFADALNWIGGELRPAISNQWKAIDDPHHGKELGKVAQSGAADVDAAVQIAKRAQPAWRAVPMRERAQVLYRFKALMERDLEELAWLISLENGKTPGEGKAEAEKGIECVEFACSLGQQGAGEFLDVSRGVSCRTIHEPLGVVAGIAPFNFPTMVPLWMAPNALVGGNAFILKPSDLVPYGSLKLAALLEEAGLPTGIFQVVQGGKESVEALIDHPGIEAIGFVGSTPIAKLVYGRAAMSGKRALALGGAKNHLLVAPDCDVSLTAPTVAASAYGCAGQRCMAASLMVAIGDVDSVIEQIAIEARKWVPGAQLGPVISPEAKARIEGYIAGAEKQGAKLLVDGRGAKVANQPGHWVGPTVIDHCTPDMPASCDEIFGPVLSIVRVPNLEAAIQLQNRSPYGNAAAIFTRNGGIARACVDRFGSGMIGVNVGVPVPREPFAFGGWKQSKFGHGDITGMDGFRFWTQPRKVTEKWAVQSDATWMS